MQRAKESRHGDMHCCAIPIHMLRLAHPPPPPQGKQSHQKAKQDACVMRNDTSHSSCLSSGQKGAQRRTVGQCHRRRREAPGLRPDERRRQRTRRTHIRRQAGSAKAAVMVQRRAAGRVPLTARHALLSTLAAAALKHTQARRHALSHAVARNQAVAAGAARQLTG